MCGPVIHTSVWLKIPHTFKKHPEKGREMKESDYDLTHAQNRQHRLKIVCPDEILKS